MPDRVVVFDTSCLLCSRFINILILNDRNQLYFTGFESSFAAKTISKDYLDDPETVIFVENDKIFIKSEAVLSILKYTRLRYRWLRIFAVLPRPFLDGIYDWVAKNRYSWFGQSDQCYLPTADQSERFLD